MQQMIHKIRDKYTYWLLLLFVPLEVLPFLCESDSTMGKALLLIKAALFGLLYILYADKQKWYIHVMLLITCVFMGMSVLKHGGAGTALLILTMFFALIAFPKVEIEENRLRCLYFLLAIGGAGVTIYGMIMNYSNGITAFSWRGFLNPNMFGVILLSVLFFSLSCMHLKAEKNGWMDFVLFIFMLYLIYKTSCRSALLCGITLVFLYVIVQKTKFGRIAYYVIAVFSIVFCFVVAITEIKLNVSDIANEWELFGKKIFSGREYVWAAVLEGFIKSPLWGQSSEYLIEHTNYASAHNVLMGILIALGIIPCLLYLKLLLSPKTLLNYEDKIKSISKNKIFFIVCIILASFECVFTDNRSNILFLPLLFSTRNIGLDVASLRNTMCDVHMNNKVACRSIPPKYLEHRFLMPTLFVTCLLLIINIIEPTILSITHEALPMKADLEYFEKIGYGDDTINLLMNKDYKSEEKNKVIWEWNDSDYEVIGTAESISFVNLYSSSKELPDWAQPGEQYHVIFEAEIVRFQAFYYLSDGQPVCFVDTTTSIDFTIPEDIKGLTLRIAVREGETARERVMPIIYAIENESRRMTEKKEKLLSYRDKLLQHGLNFAEFETQNLLENKYNPSKEYQGVKWEWNGISYNAIGTAESISFINLYASSMQLPCWAETGKRFRVIYEADKVRFQIFYYTSDEKPICFVDTTTSTEFSIPEEAYGLTIRIALLPGETTKENVMPIICPLETE